MTDRLITSSLFVLSLCLTAARALAGPVACGERPITVGFYEAGFLYYEQDGQGKGIDPDILAELGRRTGCSFTTQQMSRARIFADLASGALDMSLSGIPTPERDRYVWFAIYGRVRVYALIRAAVAARVHGADDFLHQDQLRFGVVRTFLQPADQAQWLDQLRRAQRLHEAVNVDDLFQMLKRGRIDGLFAVPPFFRKFITDLHMQDEIIVQDWSPNDKGVRGGLMLAKSRFSEAEAERWRALIREMRDDGTLGRILGHYLPGTETKDMLDY